MKRLIFLIGFMMVVFSIPVYADTVNYVAGTIYATSAINNYQTYGDNMSGMTVTVTFADGSSETAYWAATGIGSGSASGTLWSLAESGDTFGGIWTLTNNNSSPITSLSIDAGTGDTVFDVWNDASGTPGSEMGWAFDRISSNNFDVNATYMNSIALSGNPPVGDLYRNLLLSFAEPTGAPTGLFGILEFISDTDNLSISGDINPAPEPASMLLLILGIAGLAGLRRKVE
jgi:hypothetical protein